MFNARSFLTVTRKMGTRHMSVGNVGFVGLGHMGSKMVRNIALDGEHVVVYDRDSNASSKLFEEFPDNVKVASSVTEIAEQCNTVISMLPNDAIVKDISRELFDSSGSHTAFTHISCSSVSPATSRALGTQFKEAGKSFIASPVFARPDGITRKEAIFMISGDDKGKELAQKLLLSSTTCGAGRIVDYGEDPGSANVVKLCGNFLIASSIEAIAESMALAEKHGVDRKEVMKLFSSSIFDCLIYKGYGQRVSERDHRPGGFSLELGKKDVSLVGQAAEEVTVPMPFLEVLKKRYADAAALEPVAAPEGATGSKEPISRSQLDWSAIGMSVAEDAGIDIEEDLAINYQNVRDGKTY